MRAVLLALAVVATAGTSASADGFAAAVAEGGPMKEVWVVRHSWHTRVAVRRADVDPSLWPESADLGRVTYLEVGWGDRDYYPKPDPSLLDTIDPVIRPTRAALHVGGFDPPPADFLPDAPIVALRVSATGFDALTRFIHDHYVLDAAGRPERIRRGYYEHSWFYLADGCYHALFRNSNIWVANALRAAGVPMSRAGAVTAGGVMAQAAEHGTRVGADR